MPVTTSYTFTAQNQGGVGTVSLSQAAGVQRGATLVATTGGNAVAFYYDAAVGEIAARTVARNGTLGARVQASSGSVFITTNQAGDIEPVSAARLSNGNFVVTWTSNEPTRRVYYRVFDANLSPITGAIRLDGLAVATGRPDVAALASGGGFVIAAEAQYASDDYDIIYRRFDAAGVAVDPLVTFVTPPMGLDEAPSVAGLTDGGFALAWQQRVTAAGPTLGNTIAFTAIRNADGTERIGPTLFDQFGGINRDMEVVARANGSYTIFYEDSGWTSDPNDTQLTAWNFDNFGITTSVNQLTFNSGNQASVAAALSPEGFMAFAFNNPFAPGNTDIRAGILDTNGQLLVSGNIAVAGNEERVAAVTWLDGATFRVAYESAGASAGAGDTDTSVDSRVYALTRFSDGDAANDVIDWSASVIANNMRGFDGNDTLIGGAADDFMEGGNNDDTLIGNDGNDALDAGAGTDIVDGGGGNDIIAFGAFLTAGDTVNGGTGSDQVGINGNYSGGNALVLGPNTLTNVEVLAALPGGSNSYAITTHNNTVAAGVEMTIFAGNLSLFNNFTFNGSAETDGFFRTFGGFGVDTITGGALSDGFYFGPGKWQTGDTVVGGGGANDQLALDGNYTLNIGSDADVEVLVLLSGPSGSPNTFQITLDDVWTPGGATKIVFGRNVTTNLFINGSPETNGNLTMFGGLGLDTLIGGSGVDTFYGLEGNDTLSGGAGSDTAVYQGASANYFVQTLSGVVRIIDTDGAANGDDGTDRVISIELARFTDQTINIVSPVILDLDGGGVETLNASASNAAFDMDGDGIGDDTSWFGRGEGLLFLDRNGDGTVTNAGEFSFVDDVPGAASDLEGLRAFDSNGDGELSRRDARFRDFKIWQDRNGDGIVDRGEVMTLRQAGVRSLSLTGVANNATYAIGDTAVVNTGSFTRTNGRQGGLIDAVLTGVSSKGETDTLAAMRDAVASDVGSSDTDPRLALMTQDMASFGPTRAATETDRWRREGTAQVEFFAA